MHIVCPNCTTSYAVDPANFGDSGRTVRCSRCKEVWLAHPRQRARAEAFAPAMDTQEAAAPQDDLSAWGIADDDIAPAQGTPMVESPSIASELPAADDHGDAAWTAAAAQESAAPSLTPRKPSRSWSKLWLRRLSPSKAFRLPFMPRISLATGCAGMAALVMALMIWRIDVVRLLPQTAAFYKLVGLNVNWRALAFKDVKVTSETVDGKPVLVIEGVITGESRKAVELPRLRFIVSDTKGTEIYAWNAVLEQTVLKPGEQAWFRSRLASPPADASTIDVRFFNKRDIGARGT